MKEDKANELLDNVVDVSNPPPSPTFLQGMDEEAQPTSLISTGSGQVGGGLPQVIEGPGDSGDVYPQGNDPPPLEYSQTGARPTQGVIWNWCRPPLCILFMIFPCMQATRPHFQRHLHHMFHSHHPSRTNHGHI